MLLENLLGLASQAEGDAEAYEVAAREAVRGLVAPKGKVDPAILEREQFAAHGFAWIATYVAALRQMRRWAEQGAQSGQGGELELLMLQSAFGEYLAQLSGGIAISQVEIVRPGDLGLDAATLDTPAVRQLIAANTAAVRMRIAELITDGLDTGNFGALELGDDALEEVRRQFRRFVDGEVLPYAHEWHLKDELIPLPVVEKMAELGVFGLTVPEEWGGLGMGKLAMCVVTEELSRGYIGVGSLGTRSEIAAELIRSGGTEVQKKKYLSRIASGELLPTAVFTEPNTGSDLASLKTRAVLEGDVYKIQGNKTWITHAARADIMTLLARSDASKPGYQGLSMFLAEKPRGTETDPFPAKGMSGGEIRVLGYRGMKEYEIGFDGFEVPASAVLGGVEGQGFKQLMETFESARIQTAARAVGVAVDALELGLRYAKDRVQFGKPLFAFPRVSGKLAWMATEIMIARQLTLFAAREKDADRRCDLEAGLAKLSGAAVAWAVADNSLQIHGGNGYAMEYQISRVLCDARILNIFEGAAEIQAQVIARRLLSE
jgi:(2S)-methylsuccinyl-CoA dehydrogenase